MLSCCDYAIFFSFIELFYCPCIALIGYMMHHFRNLKFMHIHQVLQILVERIVVQMVSDMEFWLLVLTHVLNDTERFEYGSSSSA